MVERGIGRGLAAILPTTRGGRRVAAPHSAGADRAEPEPAAQVLRRTGTARRSPSRCACTACCSRSSCARCPAAATSCSPASVAGARRSSRGLDRIPAVVRTAAENERLELAHDREHGARGPQPGRVGARLRGARGRVRLDEGGGRPPRRQEPRRGLEPRAPARAPRRGAGDARGRHSFRKDTAARCCRRPITTRGGASRARRATAGSRCARPRTLRAAVQRGRRSSGAKLQSADALAAAREAEDMLGALCSAAR